MQHVNSWGACPGMSQLHNRNPVLSTRCRQFSKSRRERAQSGGGGGGSRASVHKTNAAAGWNIALEFNMARGEVPVELGAVAASQGSNYRGSSRRAAGTVALALLAVAAVCFVAQSKTSSANTLYAAHQVSIPCSPHPPSQLQCARGRCAITR